MRPILNIDGESFAQYGVILDFSADFDGFFQVVASEADAPWRMAVYRPRARSCTFLEQHPTSLESFEPQRGTSFLAVAEPAAPQDYEIFLLDRPVCLFKAVWHNVVVLSDDVLIRVNETWRWTAFFTSCSSPLPWLVSIWRPPRAVEL